MVVFHGSARDEGEDGVDGLTALFAGLLRSLRALTPDFCPGGWPWAVTVLGVGVGLLPAVGAVLVALLRKRIGSRYGVVESTVLVGAGILTAGLLPLLVFTVVGRLFAGVAAGGNVEAFSRADLQDLESDVCSVFGVSLVGTQAEYLGTVSVSAAFDPSEPLRFGYALILLAATPLVTSMLVAAQARLALRRGPRWPSKFFWLPILGLAFLTVGVPYGTAGHLWVGTAAGALVGIFVVLLVGTPREDAGRRAVAAPPANPVAAGSRSPAGNRSRSRTRPELMPVPEPVRHRERVNPRDPANRDPVNRDPVNRDPVNRDPVNHREVAPRRDLDPVVRTQPAHGAPPPPVRPPPVRRPPPPPTLVETALPRVGTSTFPIVPPVGPGGTPRFKIIRRLGSGGFGRVWLAHDAQLGHTVALKAAHAPDAETEQRIRREAEALHAVRHPNCVRIHDLVPAASDPGLAELDGMVIVMGYVEGSSLGEMVRSSGVLDDIAAARVWMSVAGALDAAHNRGVFHRDVKPGNVVVDPGGLAHLIDFGIARKTGDATMTMAGFVLGTPDYLAPEVAIGERATRRSDAWQLAATVSFALTANPPRGPHTDAVSGLRAAAAGAPLSHLPRRSAHLALLHAALDTDPTQRPSLQVVQRALQNWLRGTGAQPDGPVTLGTRIL